MMRRICAVAGDVSAAASADDADILCSPSPNPTPARGRRIIVGLVLGAMLAGGGFAASAVPVHAARPLDCIAPVLCPTVSVPALPTVSLPLPTTGTTTTSTTGDPART